MTRISVLVFIVCGIGAAQEPGAFVRRFSAGGIISVSGLSLMEPGEVNQTAGSVQIKSTTNSLGNRFGGGGLLQFAFRGRYAAAGGAVLRRVSFSTVKESSLDGSTTTENDDSRADLWDFPLLVRRYDRPHNVAGHRRFYEAGVVLRRARNVRSFRETTKPDATSVCCDEAPLIPANRLASGITVGAGMQLIDQLKLRFVPELRYTYWVGRTFDTLSARSQRHQLEINLAITF